MRTVKLRVGSSPARSSTTPTSRPHQGVMTRPWNVVRPTSTTASLPSSPPLLPPPPPPPPPQGVGRGWGRVGPPPPPGPTPPAPRRVLGSAASSEATGRRLTATLSSGQLLTHSRHRRHWLLRC